MPDFQASLNNPSNPDVLGITLYPDVNTLTIIDGSNYPDSDEQGNEQPNFTAYRKIFVYDPNLMEYLFSSLTDGDTLISSGMSGNGSFQYAITAAGDGVYKVRLITVPTYVDGIVYQVTDVVYFGGNLYQSLVNPNVGQEPGSTPNAWQLITDELTVNGKYNVFANVARTYEIEKALVKQIFKALGESNYPLHNLERDFEFLKALELDLLISSIQYKAEAGEWTSVKFLIAKAKAKIAAI